MSNVPKVLENVELLEFICDNEYYIGLANDFAKEYKCEFELIEI